MPLPPLGNEITAQAWIYIDQKELSNQFNILHISGYFKLVKRGLGVIEAQNINGNSSCQVAHKCEYSKWMSTMVTISPSSALMHLNGNPDLSLQSFSTSYPPTSPVKNLNSNVQIGFTQQNMYLALFQLFSKDMSPTDVKLVSQNPESNLADLVLYYKFQDQNIYDNIPGQSVYQTPIPTRTYDSLPTSTPLDPPPSLIGTLQIDKNTVIELPVSSVGQRVGSYTVEIWSLVIGNISPRPQTVRILSICSSVDKWVRLGIFNNGTSVEKNQVQGYNFYSDRCGPSQTKLYKIAQQTWVHHAVSYTFEQQLEYYMVDNEIKNKPATQDSSNLYILEKIYIGLTSNKMKTFYIRLGDMKFWNIFRYPSNLYRNRRVDMSPLHHPNIITHYQFNRALAEGFALQNLATHHQITTSTLTILPPTMFPGDNLHLTLCQENEIYDSGLDKCLTSGKVKARLYSYKKGESSLKVYFQYTDGETVVDYWAKYSGLVSGNDILETSDADIKFQTVNFIGSTTFLCMYGPATTQMIGVTQAKKWNHYIFSSKGNQDTKILIQGRECPNGRTIKNPATKANLELNLTPTNNIDPSTILFYRELRVWIGPNTVQYAYNLMNSTILDPSQIPFLKAYAPLESPFDEFDYFIYKKQNALQIVLNSPTHSPSRYTEQDHFDINQFCEFGMFKGPSPTYHKCYLPTPVAYPHKVNASSTALSNQLLAYVDTNIVYSYQLGFWVRRSEMLANNDQQIITSEPDCYINMRFKNSDLQIENGNINNTLVSSGMNKESFVQGMWYQIQFSIHMEPANSYMYLIHKYSISGFQQLASFSLQNPLYNHGQSNLKYFKLYAGSTRLNPRDHPFSIRNLLIINGRIDTKMLYMQLSSWPLIHLTKASTSLSFFPFTQTGIQNELSDQAGKVYGALKVDARYYTIDQTFPYSICDPRFAASDTLGTCGVEAQVKFDGLQYIMELNQNSDSHKVFVNGANNDYGSKTIQTRVWVWQDPRPGYHIPSGVFQVGSDDTIYAPDSLRFGLMITLDQNGKTTFQVRAAQQNIGLKIGSFSQKLTTSQVENKWAHYTLVRVNETHFNLVCMGNIQQNSLISISQSGKYFHSYKFGCVYINNSPQCFKGKIREFMVLDLDNIPGLGWLYSGTQFKMQTIFYHPFLGSASEHMIYFRQLSGGANDIILTYGSLKATITSYDHNPQSFFKPTTTPQPSPYIESSTPMAHLVNQQQIYTGSPIRFSKPTFTDTYNSYMIVFNFLLTDLQQYDTLLYFPALFSLDLLNKRSRMRFQCNYNNSLNNYNTNLLNLNLLGWNSLIIGITTTQGSKRQILLNGKVVMSLDTNIGDSQKLNIVGKQYNLETYVSIRSFMIYPTNNIAQQGFDPYPFIQFLSQRILPRSYQMSYTTSNLIHHTHLQEYLPSLVPNKVKLYSSVQPKQVIKQHDMQIANQLTPTTSQILPTCYGNDEVWTGNECISTHSLVIDGLNTTIPSRPLHLPLPIGFKDMAKFQVELWFISVSTSGGDVDLFKLYKSDNNSIFLQVFVSSVQYLCFTFNSSLKFLDSIQIRKNFNRWQQVQMTFKVKNITLYINEQLVHDGAFTSLPSFDKFMNIITLGSHTTRKVSIKYVKIRSAFHKPTSTNLDQDIIDDSVISYWPLDKVGTGQWVYDSITGHKASTVGIPWYPSRIFKGETIRAFFLCPRSQSFSENDGTCKPSSKFVLEHKASDKSAKYIIRHKHGSLQEWTVEFYFKVNFLNPDSFNGQQLSVFNMPNQFQVNIKYLSSNAIAMSTRFFKPGGNVSVTDSLSMNDNNKWIHFSLSRSIIKNGNKDIGIEVECQKTVKFIQAKHGECRDMDYIQRSETIYIGFQSPPNNINVAIQELRLWSTAFDIQRIKARATSNLSPTTPYLETTLKFFASEYYDSFSQTFTPLTQNPIKLDSDYIPVLLIDCPYDMQFDMAKQTCTHSYNSAFIPSKTDIKSPTIQVKEFDQQLKANDHRMGLQLWYKCIKLPTSQKQVLLIINKLLISINPDRSALFTFFTLPSVIQESISKFFLPDSKWYQFAVAFQPHKQNVKVQFGSQMEFFKYYTVKDSQYKPITKLEIQFGSIGTGDYIHYGDLNLYYPTLAHRYIWTQQNLKSRTNPFGEAGVYIPLMQYKSMISVYQDTQYLNLIHGQGYYIQNYPQSIQGPQFCPFSMIRDTVSDKCHPYGTLVLKGAQSIQFTPPYQIYSEVTAIVEFRVKEFPVQYGANRIMGLTNVLAIDVHKLSNDHNVQVVQFDCSGNERKFGQILESKSSFLNKWQTHWMTLSRGSQWYTSTNQQSSALCDNYKGKLNKIVISTNDGTYQIKNIYIFSQYLNQYEISRVTTIGSNDIQNSKFMLSHFRFYLRTRVIQDLMTNMDFRLPIILTQKSYIQYQSTSMPALANHVINGDRYYTQNQNLFLPRGVNFQPVKAVISPGQRVENELTVSVCLYVLGIQNAATKSNFAILKYTSLELKRVASYFSIQISSNEYLKDVTFTDTNQNALNRWICLGIGMKTINQPNLEGSLLYFISDKNIEFPRQIHIQSSTNQIYTNPLNFNIEYAIIGQLNTTEGPAAYMAEFKVFTQFISHSQVHREILKHSVTKSQFPSLVIYFKLDEAGSPIINNLGGSGQLKLDYTPPNINYPVWLQSPSRLVICEGDSVYIHQISSFQGFCMPEVRFASVQKEILLSSNSDGLEGSQGFYMYSKDRTQSLKYGIKQFYELTITHQSKYSITHDLGQTLLSHPNQITGLYNQWIYCFIRYSSEHMLIELSINVNKVWADVKQTDIVLNFVQQASVKPYFGLGSSPSEPVILRDLVYYKHAIASEVLKWRSDKGNLMVADSRALTVFYRLDESSGQLIFNSAPHENNYIKTSLLSNTITWIHYKSLINSSIPMIWYCRRGQFQNDQVSCTKIPQKCESCPKPLYGPKTCVTYTSSFTSCMNLQQPNAYYDKEINEYLQCYKLCLKCDGPYLTKGCLECVDGYSLNDTNHCEPKCKEGLAYNTNMNGNNACQRCTHIGCNCLPDNFDICISCTSVSGLSYIFNRTTGTNGCEQLPSGYFYNKPTSQFIRCHHTCAECDGPYDSNCSSCVDTNDLLKEGQCHNISCGLREYRVNGRCKICHQKCLTCSGPTSNECLSCPSQDHVYNQSSNQCIKVTDLYNKSLIQLPGQTHYFQKCNDAGVRLDGVIGVQNPVWYCNDGNLVDGDGCSKECRIEEGYKCEPGNTTTPDRCKDFKRPSCRIIAISSDLVVSIQFSEIMSQAINQVNISHFDITIKGPRWSYPLTWEPYIPVQKVKNKIYIMKIKLHTKSFLYGIETLKIQITSSRYLIDLANNSVSTKTMTATLPKYYHLSNLQLKAATTSGNAMVVTSLITVMLNFITSVLSGTAMILSWDFINAIQLMYYIPLIALYYPPFLRIVLSYFGFAMADLELLFLIPDSVKSVFVIPFNLEDKPLSDTYADFGIQSTIIMKLYADKLLLWTLIAAMYVPIKLLALLSRYIHQNGRCISFMARHVMSLEKGYRYNSIIRIILELYLEMTLYAFINVYSLNYNTYQNTIASLLGIGFILIVTFLPTMLSIIIVRHYHTIKSDYFKATYSQIILGMKMSLSKPLTMHFNSAFLYRRFMYVMILVFLRFWPMLQITLCVGQSLLTLAWLLYLRPYVSIAQLILNLTNESLVLVLCSVCCSFITPMQNQVLESTLAYTMTGLLLIFVAINVMFIMVEVIKQIRQVCKNFKKTSASLPKVMVNQPQIINNHVNIVNNTYITNQTQNSRIGIINSVEGDQLSFQKEVLGNLQDIIQQPSLREHGAKVDRFIPGVIGANGRVNPSQFAKPGIPPSQANIPQKRQKKVRGKRSRKRKKIKKQVNEDYDDVDDNEYFENMDQLDPHYDKNNELKWRNKQL